MKKKSLLILLAAIISCSSCGLKEDINDMTTPVTVQAASEKDIEEKAELIAQEEVNNMDNNDSKEIFTYTINKHTDDFIVGEEVDKNDILLYEKGELHKTDFNVRLMKKCYEKYTPILDELFAKEISEYDLDPGYKEEVYSVIKKSEESFRQNCNHENYNHLNVKDFMKEYYMIEELGEEAVPYILCYANENENGGYAILLNRFIQKMTGITIIPPHDNAELCNLNDAEIELYDKSFTNRARSYLILKKYNERKAAETT